MVIFIFAIFMDFYIIHTTCQEQFTVDTFNSTVEPHPAESCFRLKRIPPTHTILSRAGELSIDVPTIGEFNVGQIQIKLMVGRKCTGSMSARKAR
jgi:hypothetical protein